MRKLWMIVLAAFSFVAMSAQDAAEIRRSPEYIYAEASATDMHTADSIAVEGMVSRIAACVSLPFPDNTAVALIRSYREDIRRECAVMTLSGTDGVSSLRYMRKDMVDRIFARRRAKVQEMRSVAETAEGRLQIDVALRYWTWVSSLLRSLPPVDAVAIAEADARKAAIIDGLHVAMSQESLYGKELIELRFTWRGEDVRSVDYSVFDGQHWSGMLSAKDGRGFVELRPGTELSEYKVRYEVDPSRLWHIYREVKEVETALYGNASAASFSAEDGDAVQTIDMSEVKRKVLDVVAGDKFQTLPALVAPTILPVTDPGCYSTAVSRLCSAVGSGDYDSVRDIFTDDGWNMFNALVRYGNARVLTPDRLSFYRLGDEVWCRSVPMAFTFNGNPRRFVENLVFAFDRDGLICNLSFALSAETVRSIFSHEEWSEDARIIIVTFLENYKTAYALKRLDYISSIFDEDALIITGRVLKTAPGERGFGGNHYARLTRQSKKSYIARLEKVFDSQEFINIQFTDSKVMKLGKGEQLFGLQLRQEYWSSTYADAGYLFVLVDLSDYARPMIHVRTWQEEPDAEYGIIGPYSF